MTVFDLPPFYNIFVRLRLRLYSPMYSPSSSTLSHSILFPCKDTVKQPLKKFFDRKVARYGIALDNRHSWTIQPWLTWQYSLRIYSNEEFAANFAEQVFSWVHETPDRWPLSDWWEVNERE